MKSFRVHKLLVTVLGMILAAGLATAQAADSGGIIRDYDVTVPPSQDHAFREGMKRWQKCLHDHGSTQAVYAYDAETGDTDGYAFLLPHASWADMDQHSAAGKACRETFVRAVAPHFSEVWSGFLKVNPKITHDPGTSEPMAPFVWVIDYRIKSGKYREFMAAAHAMTAAAEKTQWEDHFVGYDVLAGGQGSPQVLIVQPNESWAEIGEIPNPTLRKMMEGVYGKAATAALYHKFAHSLRDAWSRIWSYDKELSVVAPKSR